MDLCPETITQLSRFLITQDIIETHKGPIPPCVEEGRVVALRALTCAPEEEISSLARAALQPLFTDEQDPRTAYDRLAEIDDAIQKIRWEAIVVRDCRKKPELSQTLRFQSSNGTQYIKSITPR